MVNNALHDMYIFASGMVHYMACVRCYSTIHIIPHTFHNVYMPFPFFFPSQTTQVQNDATSEDMLLLTVTPVPEVQSVLPAPPKEADLIITTPVAMLVSDSSGDEKSLDGNLMATAIPTTTSFSPLPSASTEPLPPRESRATPSTWQEEIAARLKKLGTNYVALLCHVHQNS